ISFSKDAPLSSATASEQNEEWIRAMVDTTDEEMVDVTSDNPIEDVPMPALANARNAVATPFEFNLVSCFLFFVKDNQEKDKFGSKPDKNEKRGKAGKSLK
nr:hypothetical protein [Tanacetum cinerariifolium]